MTQLQQEIQNELTTANQLLNLISLEVKEIKELTKSGSDFEFKIKHNAALISTLANILHINFETENLSPTERMEFETTNKSNQNVSNEEHETFRDITNIDDSQ